MLWLFLAAQCVYGDHHEPGPEPQPNQTNGGSGETEASLTTARDIGYFFGYSMGNSMRSTGVSEVDEAALLEGLEDALASRESVLDGQQVRAVTDYIRALRARAVSEANALRAEKLEREAEKSRVFLQSNASQAGVQITESGLQYIIENPGTGPRPTSNSVVEVTYRGTLTDGTEFDATNPGKTVTFSLQHVIGGWSEGVPLIARGGKVRLFVPPKLGYGERGTPNIPPNAVLVFDVSLVDFK